MATSLELSTRRGPDGTPVLAISGLSDVTSVRD